MADRIGRWRDPALADRIGGWGILDPAVADKARIAVQRMIDLSQKLGI